MNYHNSYMTGAVVYKKENFYNINQLNQPGFIQCLQTVKNSGKKIFVKIVLASLYFPYLSVGSACTTTTPTNLYMYYIKLKAPLI